MERGNTDLQLAVITDEISQDFEHALDVMLGYNCRGAELRGLWGVNIADLTTSQLERARCELEDREMVVAGLSTPLFKCHLLSDVQEEGGNMHLAPLRGFSDQTEILKRCIHNAQTLGTHRLRVFGFWKSGQISAAILERIAEAFQPALAIAEHEDVTLVLENEHSCMLGTGAETAELLQLVNHPRLRGCWDPGNCLLAGQKPFPEGYISMKPWIDHIHVKDAVIDSSGTPRWCIIGEGEIGYREHFDRLKQDGYNGWISLETHYVPQGGTAEDGSIACLEALRRML